MGGNIGAAVNNPLALAVARRSSFEARLYVRGAGLLRIEALNSNDVEVNGQLVTIAAQSLFTTDNLVTIAGASTGAAMVASTVYYVYLSNLAATFPEALRASAVSPTPDSYGTLYLDLDGTPGHEWRFVGVVFTNAAVQFLDDAGARHLANYYNRQPKALYTCPGYTDDAADTFYNSVASATFAKINGGTGDTVSFLTFDELGVTLGVCASVRANGAADSHVGLAVNDFGGTLEARAAAIVQTAALDVAVSVQLAPIVGLGSALGGTVNEASVVIENGGLATSIYADFDAAGATADVPATYLWGLVWC